MSRDVGAAKYLLHYSDAGNSYGLYPYWLVSSRSNTAPSSYSTLRYAGLPLIIVGAAGLLWCIWDFFAAGRGTLAPVDPPKHLVVRGLYRYLRNPMYVAVVSMLLGEAIFFLSKPVLIEAAIFFMLANAFVMLYEEPALRSQFGASYDEYKRTTGRWLPKCRNKSWE